MNTRFCYRSAWLFGMLSALCASRAVADDAALIDQLRQIDTRVIAEAEAAAAREAVDQDVQARLQAANHRESATWHAIDSLASWEAYRDERLARLKAAITKDAWPTAPSDVQVTRRTMGDGFAIEHLVFQSRPGNFVTAHLYLPARPSDSMPGILICHSHHAPKQQGELQDMGMTWARNGAAVLIMDQLGHGERRTHRFAVAESYPGPFRPGRQDYFFRYNTGVQLAVAGESLMGWMVGDLMCGASLLTSRPGVDPQRLILLGSVAGGGDPAGVTAALDRRFAVVAPFNFGGYEPEDVFPLPDDAEETFDYAGSGSWESTRNLRLSAKGGFLPWVIVASIAPRRLVYAHEFRWDRERDPVWRRLQSVFDLYDTADGLGSIVGRGSVSGSSPEDSHCTNIGPSHRAQLYPLLERWCAMPQPVEFSDRHSADELRCRVDGDEPLSLHLAIQSLVQERLRKAQTECAGLPAETRREALWAAVAPLLGGVEPWEQVRVAEATREQLGQLVVERVRLNVADGDVAMPLPLLIVRANPPSSAAPPRLVVGLAQAGKSWLLRERTDVVAELIESGTVVVLVDFRGTGETEPVDDGRGRTGGTTARSASEWMLGQTVLGRQVRDLRTVLRYLRGRDEWRGARIALWGDSAAAPNPDDRDLAAPLDAEDLPAGSEPMGMLAPLFTALWEDIDGLYAAGGLLSYRTLLDGPYFYVPHDALVPEMLSVADLPEVVNMLTVPRVWLADLRDGLNRRVEVTRAAEVLSGDAISAPQALRLSPRFTSEPGAAREIAAWLTGP